MDLEATSTAEQKLEKVTLSNRRTHDRKDLRVPVQCNFETEVTFPGLTDLVHSKWVCVNLGQGGMLLETKESREPGIHEQMERIQNTLFSKGKTHPGIYYPALPPEKLQVSVEMYFPKKKNSFTFHGALAWFRHLAKGVYRMGISFDDGQDLHIYRDRSGQLVVTVIWRESDL